MQTLLEVVRKTEGFFAQKGIENPRLNAEQSLDMAFEIAELISDR